MKLIDSMKTSLDTVYLRRKVYTLENELKSVKEALKEELYTSVIQKLGEPLEVERLKKENKNLRKQIKTLKAIIKGE